MVVLRVRAEKSHLNILRLIPRIMYRRSWRCQKEFRWLLLKSLLFLTFYSIQPACTVHHLFFFLYFVFIFVAVSVALLKNRFFFIAI